MLEYLLQSFPVWVYMIFPEWFMLLQDSTLRHNIFFLPSIILFFSTASLSKNSFCSPRFSLGKNHFCRPRYRIFSFNSHSRSKYLWFIHFFKKKLRPCWFLCDNRAFLFNCRRSGCNGGSRQWDFNYFITSYVTTLAAHIFLIPVFLCTFLSRGCCMG